MMKETETWQSDLQEVSFFEAEPRPRDSICFGAERNPTPREFFTVFPYHNEFLVDKVRQLDWNFVKSQFEEDRTIFETFLLNYLQRPQFNLHRVLVELVHSFCEPLFEGYWYTSGELFLRKYTEHHYVGLFFGYVVIGQTFEDDPLTIFFHQYPCAKFKQKVTVFASLDPTHQRLEAQYILGRRPPWRPLSIVRRPPTFQKALIYAAEGNVDLIRDCFTSGYDINYRFDEFQKSTVLDIATVHNQPKMVKFLLSQNADPNIKNDSGSTPLGIARAKDYTEVVKIFEELGMS